MKTTIQQCACGNVRKLFNQTIISNWAKPNELLASMVKEDYFIIQPNNCSECRAKPGVGNALLPVRERK